MLIHEPNTEIYNFIDDSYFFFSMHKKTITKNLQNHLKKI